MAGFSILLPPSDVKVAGGNSLAPKMFDRRSSHTFNYFVAINPERRQVVEALNSAGASIADLAPTLGVPKDQLDHALGCNAEVMTSPLMSALDRYSPGVMYQSMDFENLPTGAQRRLLEHGVIFSPLYGVLRPDDLIPEYYLAIDAVLPDVGSVREYWAPFITQTLNDLFVGHFVWNLFPDEIRSVWEPDDRYRGVVEVGFFSRVKGRLTPITENLDQLRGRFVNTLVRGPSDSIDALAEFDESGMMSVVDVKWNDTTRRGFVSVVPG